MIPSLTLQALMLGPLFTLDWIRLARKRRNVYVRCGFLAALLAGWWYVYQAAQPFNEGPNDYARLATAFTYTLLGFQYALILVVTPIYLAGTIAEERENRTLELLFQTQLSDREILLGKFAARLTHLAFLVLLSLPILAIISLWGGIDVEFLAFHYACLLLFLLVLASACLLVSTSMATQIEAVATSYAMSLGVLYGIGILIAIGRLIHEHLSPFIALAICAAPCLVVSYLFYRLALSNLSQLRDVERISKPKRTPERPVRPAPPRPKHIPTWPSAPPVYEPALLWKEIWQARAIANFPVHILWLGVVGASLLSLSAFWARIQSPWGSDEVIAGLGAFWFMGYVVLVIMVLVLHALDATASVARERERGTLEFLLLLPMARAELLFYKAIGPVVGNRYMLGLLLGLPALAMMCGLLPVRVGLVLLLSPWPTLCLVSALGLYLSVICRRVLTANIALVVILLVILAGHGFFFDDFKLLMMGGFHLAGIPMEHGESPSTGVARFVMEQVALVLGAGALYGLTFWQFGRKSYDTGGFLAAIR